MKKLKTFFQGLNGQHLLLVTHERPDGDALGSIFALTELLQENGHRVDFFIKEQINSHYLQLLPKLNFLSSLSASELHKYNQIIALDTATLDRLELLQTREKPPVPLIVIDHHKDNSCFGDQNFIFNMSSNAQIIFHLAHEMQWKISKKTANALLIAMLTDTGGLRFSNTNESCCKDVGELISLGAEHQRIINGLYFNKPLKQKLFESDLLLNDLTLAYEGKLGILCVHEQMLKKHDVKLSEMEFLIDEVRMIDTVEIAMMLSSLPEGAIKVSLRSKNEHFLVGPIARSLGGGGHDMAAGIKLKNTSFDEVTQLLIMRFSELFNI